MSRGTDAFENKLIDYIESLRQRNWKQPSEPFRGPTMRLTLLHLASALGYCRLITALTRFKTENPSLVIDYEVDPLNIDDRACNPVVGSIVMLLWMLKCFHRIQLFRTGVLEIIFLTKEKS